jgi:hypothetical protein
MHRARLLIGFLLGLACLGLAATVYDGALARFHGDTILTNLHTGAVYHYTPSNWFFVGSSSSNPVKIADAAWSNNVTAAITNGLVSGLTTNLSLLSSATNTVTLVFTNGLLQGVQ